MNFVKYKTNFRNLVVGVNTKIPLINGSYVTAINFDNAATTPPFVSVLQEIIRFAPWYSSIHRGTGYKSQFSSNLYEQSRDVIARFVKADPKKNTVIFVKNTTEAINKLAYRFCEEGKKKVVLSTCMEHHSNDLPWRDKYKVDYIDIDECGRLSMEDLERKLRKYKDSIALVAVTGASNVTGYRNPIHKIAALVHQYHGKILVDGAQLIPHVPFDMKPDGSPEHIDFLVFSAHKMYAPFGIGVLIGPKSVFEQGVPADVGGGTIEIVTHDFIRWAEPPHKEEAGSPNIIGVVALAAAVRMLESIGMENVERYERSLTDYALCRIRTVPGLRLYGNKEDCQDRVAIIPFNIEGMPHDILAAILSYEAGIAVRNGCFCAQPYVQRLLNIPGEEVKKRIQDPKMDHPGMVRISFGIYNHYDEINVLVQMLHKIAAHRDDYLLKYKKILNRA
ncbi:aminotransferase class V-fold PLP-dependent enzyme [Thermotalea metallivorans]|uniref:Cysteine desulfurase SufS n=1 Tax=Thermotalea metallivorans TaxID=520762 RepID=A0A140L001_9FIRM|nr:aminotransferase class V-fold PLP-dependent enzyme [Thermotalea metallivorans]KXG73876.1 Cysteine desulfurase SufS [Thermotalea metallivorans]